MEMRKPKSDMQGIFVSRAGFVLKCEASLLASIWAPSSSSSAGIFRYLHLTPGNHWLQCTGTGHTSELAVTRNCNFLILTAVRRCEPLITATFEPPEAIPSACTRRATMPIVVFMNMDFEYWQKCETSKRNNIALASTDNMKRFHMYVLWILWKIHVVHLFRDGCFSFTQAIIHYFRGRFPRVFGEEFCDKFGDEFSESPNLVMN